MMLSTALKVPIPHQFPIKTPVQIKPSMGIILTSNLHEISNKPEEVSNDFRKEDEVASNKNRCRDAKEDKMRHLMPIFEMVMR